EEAAGRVVRVPLLEAASGGAHLVEATYDLPRNQPEAEGLWQTSMHVPEVLGNVFVGKVRWQVTMPSSWVPVVFASDVHVEQEWSWPSPQPSHTSAQLEQWLTRKTPTEDGVVPSLICARSSLEPLRVLRL